MQLSCIPVFRIFVGNEDSIIHIIPDLIRNYAYFL